MIGNPLQLSFAKYSKQKMIQWCSAWPIGQDITLYLTHAYLTEPYLTMHSWCILLALSGLYYNHFFQGTCYSVPKMYDD